MNKNNEKDATHKSEIKANMAFTQSLALVQKDIKTRKPKTE
jgi:hypothetical protein